MNTEPVVYISSTTNFLVEIYSKIIKETLRKSPPPIPNIIPLDLTKMYIINCDVCDVNHVFPHSGKDKVYDCVNCQAIDKQICANDTHHFITLESAQYMAACTPVDPEYEQKEQKEQNEKIFSAIFVSVLDSFNTDERIEGPEFAKRMSAMASVSKLPETLIQEAITVFIPEIYKSTEFIEYINIPEYRNKIKTAYSTNGTDATDDTKLNIRLLPEFKTQLEKMYDTIFVHTRYTNIKTDECNECDHPTCKNEVIPIAFRCPFCTSWFLDESIINKCPVCNEQWYYAEELNAEELHIVCDICDTKNIDEHDEYLHCTVCSFDACKMCATADETISHIHPLTSAGKKTANPFIDLHTVYNRLPYIKMD